MKLLQVDTLQEAFEKLREAAEEMPLRTETKEFSRAFGRILAEDVRSEEPIPAFRRSSVDGYAVRSADTAGATDSIPVFLEVIEEVAIGHPALRRIGPGACAYVPTGGMIPEGADAMVMVEYTEPLDGRHVAVNASVPYGKFVVEAGEDVKKGETVLARGTRIDPAQAGVLAAVGASRVEVYAPWRVSILSTGDELVPVDCAPGPGQVRDINTWTLSAAALHLGMEIVGRQAVADDEGALEEAICREASRCDLLLVSGGSSQGRKDATMEALDRVSGGGVFTHGLALKPGKPTILGYDAGRRTILAGLPGHPVAALTVFSLLFGRLWRELTGQREPLPVPARMDTNLPAAPGKATCVPVRLAPEGCGAGGTGLFVVPLLGKSGLITTVSGADGYILMDRDQEGIRRDETVLVYRYF